MNRLGRPETSCESELAEKVQRWLDRVKRPVTRAQLCERFRVPERTLRGIFSREYGIGYHQLVRLKRVREELLSRAPEKGAVSKVATRLGFWHMGRFCQHYKKLFGETPTETLKRR